MWCLSRILTAALLAGAAGFLPAAVAIPQIEKKIELMKETGVFSPDTPKDKVKTECPAMRYSLPCTAGRTYTIYLRSEEFDAWLRLEDPNGKTIMQDDDSGKGKNDTDARIVFKATKAGTYTIAATSYDATAKGKYTLHVYHDGMGAEQPMSYLLDKMDKLTKDDPIDKDRGVCYCKTFKIALEANKTYVIQLDSREFDAYLRLFNSAGKEVACDDDGAKDGLNAKIVYPCPAAGEYSIVATSYLHPDLGEFHLRVHVKSER